MTVRKTETYTFTCDRPGCGMTARSSNVAAMPPQWKRLLMDDYWQGLPGAITSNKARHLCPSCQLGLESYLRTDPEVIQVPVSAGEENAVSFVRGWFTADREVKDV